MTLTEYLQHYFNIKNMLAFEALAILVLIISLLIIIAVDKVISGRARPKKRAKIFYERATSHVERFYEMIFSGASILSFLSVYYLIERFVTTGSFRSFWDAHKDLLLLLMIVISCLLNSFLDRVLVPLKHLDASDRGSVRMIGMLYIILIFVYIKFIYENNNYDGFIIYFLGLMVGRFIYFDASFKDFVKSVRAASRNFPLMVLGLAGIGLMCYVGFDRDYLMISNGVLVSCFIAHIFMLIAIFAVNLCGLTRLVIKPVKAAKKQDYEEEIYEEDEDCEEYDEYTDEYSEAVFNEDDDY